MAIEVAIKKKLKGFTLDVSLHHEGRCLGILGASGCGKSMTLKCIAGIMKPDEGRILLNDTVFYDSETKINVKPQARRVGYLFQNYALFPNMTVFENISAGYRGMKEQKNNEIDQYMERFHLKGLEKRYPSQLSGGQQQRVALARILVNQPDMIMLDEPFSALDSYLKDVLQRELVELLEGYKGDVIIVTHSRDEIYKFCDKLTIMDAGKQIINGNTKDVFLNPQYEKAARLTGCKNISPIKKINDYRCLALNWNVELNTERPISNRIKYIGIRAHSIIPTSQTDLENVMQIHNIGSAQTPFEYEYILKNRLYRDSQQIWWKIAKQSAMNPMNQKSFPDYIHLPKKELMLLE